MVDAYGEHRVQGLKPGTEVYAGNTKEQIGADIREAAGARRLDGLDRVRTGVEPLEKAQRVGLQALHADAEPVDPRREPALDARAGSIARVRLERHFGSG